VSHETTEHAGERRHHDAGRQRPGAADGAGPRQARDDCVGQLRRRFGHLAHANHRAQAAQSERHRDHRRQGAGRTAGGPRKKGFRRPDEWPYDRFSVIEPVWAGATCAIIGGGPSITPDQLADLKRLRDACGWRVIAVNTAYLAANYAEICYFADSKWWRWHKDREEFKAFQGLKVSIQQTGDEIDDDSVHMLRNAAGVPHDGANFGDSQAGGLSPWPNALRTGLNGGYQALGLAIALGATRIVLLGYDMKFTAGKSHFHGGHPDKLQDDGVYRTQYAKFFELLKLPPGVTVLNASPDSLLKCFPKVNLKEVVS
jgi:hypothetical protein